LYVPADFTGGTFTQALQDALASGATTVELTGSGTITAQCDIPAFVTLDCKSYTLTKGFNGDMLTLASAARFVGKLAGVGATFTGRGIVLSAGDDQKIDANITDMNGYCVEVATTDIALRLELRGFYQRTTATNPAIKIAVTAAESAGERKLIGCQTGGGNLVDLAGSQNTHLIGCSMANFTDSANARKAIILGCRIASAGADIDILGQDHVLSGGIYAGNIDLNSGSGNCVIADPLIANTFNITDNSGGVTHRYDWEWDTTPVWSATGTAPAIGNGSLTARVRRTGRFAEVRFTASFGSTTTFGTGSYFFTLPSPYNWNAKSVAHGAAYGFDSGTGHRAGTVLVTSGAPQFRVYRDGSGAEWGQAEPITWANGDRIEFTARYEVGA
jgi:hypothetical protein